MTDCTLMLSWLHWGHLVAQKFAVVGSALFAGATMNLAWRSNAPDARAGTNQSEPTKQGSGLPWQLSGLAAATAIAALLAAVWVTAGPVAPWAIAVLVEGLCAAYLLTELRRTHAAIAILDPRADSLVQGWQDRQRGQYRWLALHSSWVPWMLIFSL